MLKAPVFILGAHKSGTSLLRSLLDGHPHLFVFPKEPHFFAYTGHWIQYALRRRTPKTLPRTRVLSEVLTQLEADNNDTNPYSDLPQFSGYDLTRFRAAFQPRSSGLRDLYEAYLAALYEALHCEPFPMTLRMVDKSTDNLEYATLLSRLFPDARFIHVVRNPYAHVVSIRRYLVKRQGGPYPLMHGPASAIHTSLYTLYRGQLEIPDYLVLKYEEIVRAPIESMRQVAEFLGVPFDTSLLTPTVGGNLWPGNSTRDVAYSGVSTAPLQAWQNEITPYEIELVNHALTESLSLCQYEPLYFPGRRAWLRPNPEERPRTYVANRALLWALGK